MINRKIHKSACLLYGTYTTIETGSGFMAANMLVMEMNIIPGVIAMIFFTLSEIAVPWIPVVNLTSHKFENYSLQATC